MTTLEKVSSAADQLFASGHRPSVRSVRRHLGGGSPNVLAAHLRTWRTSRQVVPGAETPASIVAEVAGVAPLVWNAALAAAKKHVQSELDRAAAALQVAEEATDELQGLLDEATTQLDQVRVDRQRDLEEARAARASLVDQVQHLQEMVANRDAEALRRESIIAESQAALKAEQEHAVVLTAKISLAEQSRDLERERHLRELGARDALAAEAANRLREMNELRASAVDVAAGARQEAVSLALRLTEARAAHDRAQREFLAERSKLEAELTLFSKKLGERDEQVKNLAAGLSNERGRAAASEARLAEITLAHERLVAEYSVQTPVLERLGKMESLLLGRSGPTS